jgi:hypothetical protein
MPEKMTAADNRVTSTLIALTIFTIAILLTGCSDARGRVVKTNADYDVRLVNGELDYGLNVTVTVKNVGEPGSLRITPRVSTSEGEWDRTQNLHFDAGETKELSYFFHEMSINAQSVHYGASVFPAASQ